MVVAELDEVTFDLEVDGEVVRRQLARKVWQRAGWATIACRYEERTSAGEWKAKVAVLRFRHEHDVWKRQAAITLSADEAGELGNFLSASL